MGNLRWRFVYFYTLKLAESDGKQSKAKKDSITETQFPHGLIVHKEDRQTQQVPPDELRVQVPLPDIAWHGPVPLEINP